MQQQPYYPKQAQPGQPQPVPNYVSYSRTTTDRMHTEHILVRDGVIVGHWTGSDRLNLPLEAPTLAGVRFSQVKQGFTLASPDVTVVLLHTYHAASRTVKGGGQIVLLQPGG